MKQVNELSPQLAYKAQQGAEQRGDPRGQAQAKKFGAYAQKQTSKTPDLRFTDETGKSVIASLVTDTPRIATNYGKLGQGYITYARDTIGKNIALFISMSKKPYQIYSISGGGEDRVFVDRPSAIKLAQILKVKPTDFSMQARQPVVPQSQTPEYTIENLMKEDLKVHRFSLKQIVENLDKIPEKTGKFGEPSNNLSQPEKRKMLAMLGRFGKHGQSLRGDGAIREAAKELSELAAMAKKYAMNENNSDFIQKETVLRDFKQMDGIVKEFQTLAQECVNSQMQLAALYEDYGNVMERYYSMDSINEAGGISIPEDVQTTLNKSECSTCGCGNPNDNHNVKETRGTDGEGQSIENNPEDVELSE
jgi:hypothetical protein